MQRIKILGSSYLGETFAGEYLDLAEDFSIELTKTNILYAFEDAACERSTSFSIPRTAKNDKILMLPGMVSGYDARTGGTPDHTDAPAARHQINAVFEDGVVSKSGWLHIDSVAADSYDCIFLTGELLNLLKIVNLGKLSEYLSEVDLGVAYYLSTGAASAQSTALGMFDCVQYVGADSSTPLRPSATIAHLVNQAVIKANALLSTNFAVSVSSVFPDYDKYRIIIGKPNNVRKMACSLVMTGDLTSNTIDRSAACPFGSIFDAATITLQSLFQGATASWSVASLKAMANVTLTFPNDTTLIPNTLSLRTDYAQQGTSYEGDLYVDADGTTADNLAGKTIKIARGTVFFIANSANYIDTPTEKRYTSLAVSATGSTADPVYIEGDGDVLDGDWVRLCDNLPDVTLLDLLRIWGAVSGMFMDYSENFNTLTFTDGDPTGTYHYDINIDNVTEIGEVTRMFGGWAQKNVIGFDSDDEVESWEKITRIYKITNDNIDTENEILTMPVSEGKTTARNEVRINESESPTLCKSGAALPTANLGRVTLAANTHLTDLCTASTQMEITMKGSALDFSNITQNARLIWRNLAWVWTEATYSDGLIRLSISKIF